jgi:ribonucleoside-triphosphate reductase
VIFEPSKIAAALAKAGQASGDFDEAVAEELARQVVRQAAELPSDELEVERIQDLVENVLLGSVHRRAAKAYILYRELRAQVRALTGKANADLMDGYLNRLDWKIRENSNMGFSLQGLNNYISSEITSEYWLNRIYSSPVREAHRSGDFHIHDLNQLSVYCVGWDLADLLKEGFKGVSGNVESAPPKHFHSALGQLVNFFYTLQGEAAGAQAVSNFDTLLAPFVRADGLDFQEVRQALQEFVFNINIPTRVGFQTPFTNITMDLVPPAFYRDVPAVVGGVEIDASYGQFQPEIDLINRAFAEVMMAGDNLGRVFTFPIPTYNIVKDFDWDNPGLEAVWRMTGRYGLPYFSNFVNSDMSPDDARSMCCRLRLDNRELRKRGGGLFGANPLTGSVGVVTLNLPRLGLTSRDEAEFFEGLDRLVDLARESLTVKRKTLEAFTEKGLYPYSKHYLRGVKQASGRYWSNHFSTVGVVGANEACLNLFGQDISTPRGLSFSLKILHRLRSKLAAVQNETGDFYNLEATPAEGASYRLARLDMERHPTAVFANGPAGGRSSAPFYTNSTHLPVNRTDDLFEALELQDELQCCYTGGTVLHSFLGETVTDPEAIKSLVRKISSNFRLPYFTITPTFSICPEHGYLSGEIHECPTCAANTDVYSRVVGYLRPVARWNDGKQAEFALRRPYRGPEAYELPDDDAAPPPVRPTASRPSFREAYPDFADQRLAAGE